MFRKIAATVPAYRWAPDGTRYRKLDLYDRILDGTFYDGLKAAFYDEMEQGGQAAIPIADRRPSVQYRLARMVARWSARKLFSGRHAPRIRHKDADQRKKVEAVLVATGFYRKMMDIVIRGSVGSVGVTFRVEERDGEKPRANICVWNSKWCWPSFDTLGELAALRVCYITTPSSFQALNIPNMKKLEPTRQYWFVRDFLPNSEVTHQPILDTDWDPVNGFTEASTVKNFEDWEVIDHDFGFVPGHWFKNLSGGCDPDGCCTFEDAIPDSIELDYVFSQVARGTRYNCAPQPVIKGNLLNPGDMTRGPAVALFLEADRKDGDGNVISGGQAELLEMKGEGIKAGLSVIDKLHDHALEQISAARKDPQRMRGPLSGRGMEFLDEDSHDLVMELRTSYGDEGMLPLLRKMVTVLDPDVDASGMSLVWPRLYQPTAQDLAQIATALATLINPLQAAYAPAKEASSNTDGNGNVSTTPASDEVLPPEDFQLLTPDQAKLYVQSMLDLQLMELEGEAVADIVGDVDAETPDEPIETAPTPLGPEHSNTPAEGEEGAIDASLAQAITGEPPLA